MTLFLERVLIVHDCGTELKPVLSCTGRRARPNLAGRRPFGVIVRLELVPADLGVVAKGAGVTCSRAAQSELLRLEPHVAGCLIIKCVNSSVRVCGCTVYGTVLYCTVHGARYITYSTVYTGYSKIPYYADSNIHHSNTP